MNRRKFLQLVLTGTALFTTPGVAAARRGKPVNPTRKGFAANEPNLANVAPLAPDWFYSAFHRYLWDVKNVYACFFVVELAEKYDPFTAANIGKIVARPNYSGLWMPGQNEPDLNGVSPAQYVAQCMSEMDAVWAVDPTARFALYAGTNATACYVANSWFQKMWNLLPVRPYRNGVAAFHVHAYRRNGLTLKQYLSKVNAYHQAHFPDREFWITEIGHLKGLGYDYTPTKAAQFAQQYGFSRWAWYPQMASPANSAFEPLANADGSLTATGIEFVGL